MKFIFIIFAILMLIALFGTWIDAIRSKNKRKKNIAIVISICTLMIYIFLFFVSQITGVHELTLNSNQITFDGAEITPKKIIVDKDSRTVTLVIDYKNTKLLNRDIMESLDNKDIVLLAKQDSENLDNLDSKDIFSMGKINTNRELKFTAPTNDFNHEIKWTFSQKNGETNQIITKLK